MPGVRPGQETPSAQLGTLLLRGYTMLAEACPDCHIPLMRDPATMQSQCVGCHHFYSPAEVQALSSPQHEQPAAEPTPMSSGPVADTPAAAAAAAAQASSHGAVAGNAAQHSTRPMNGPLTSALARHRRATSTSGSSDGAGSPNLMPSAALITPATGPLSAGILSPPSSAPYVAAGAAAGAPGGGIGSDLGSESSSSRVHYHETPDAEVLQAYQQIRAERQRDEQQQLLYGRQQPPHLQQQPLQANGSAAVGPGRQQQGDVSQLMADKLLAGWALLGDHCPMCSTPLMRERATREVYCVACNLPVRVQQQPQQQQQAAAGNTGSSVQTAETPDQHSMPAQPGTAGLNGAAGGDAAAAAAANGAASDAVVLGPGPTMQLVGGTLQQSGGGAAAAAAGGRAAGAAGAAAASPAVSGQPGGLISSKQQVLGDLHHALLLKLDEARQQLLLTPAGQAEQLGVQLQLVQQLLQTLAALPQ